VAGFCYTQLTDIEQETNGLLTYHRHPKVAPEEIASIHERLFGAEPKPNSQSSIAVNEPAALERRAS
jgi:hypothetical protein